MADNTQLNSGSGGDVIASDDIGPGVKYQRVKLTLGADGVNDGDVASGNPMPTNPSDRAARDNGKIDIANHDTLATFDMDSGGGTANFQAVGIAVAASGGPVQITGDAANGFDVDVTRLPSIPAGTNNIGDVDVLTLPALPAGTNNIGDVDVLTLPALPAGASGGWTPSKTLSAASTNATSLKASAGQVGIIVATNTNASARFLKFYNKASSPTVGTDTPVLTFLIPGSTSGFTINCGVGFEFTTGIAFAITTGVADADTGAVAANEIVVNLGYK